MSYKTIKAYAQAQIEERRSRFIGQIMPVSSASEAIEFINSVKQKYSDATHNVYAYRIKDDTEKYSDDGEPGGTAGLPVMQVLKNEELLNVSLVVTRYFGGILLGSGGLVRAYSKSAKEAILAGDIITMKRASILQVLCDYNTYGKLQALLSNIGGTVNDAVFAEQITVEVLVNETETEGFINRLNDISSGRATYKITGEAFLP